MKLGLYIHIPFCKSKCYYCDFLSFSDKNLEKEYTQSLIKELLQYSKQIKKTINTIFIGGGTPSILSPNLLAQICEQIEKNFILDENIEWTIEINPATLTLEHLNIIRNTKINRVSIGLQSTHNHLLKQIGRIHTFYDWEKTINDILNIGITNINTDLMFSLPNQSLNEWESTLLNILKYPIKHISAYALILEEHTKLYNDYIKGNLNIASEELDRQMYALTKEILKNNGFIQYEISNWAKDGYACKHNIIYWTLYEYIGAGLGASGYLNNVRYTNTTNLEQYMQETDLIEEKTYIDPKMSMEEFMFLGLRMTKGISKIDFQNKYGRDIKKIYGAQIEKWKNEKALIENKSHIYLTDFGIDISNTIFTSFL